MGWKLIEETPENCTYPNALLSRVYKKGNEDYPIISIAIEISKKHTKFDENDVDIFINSKKSKDHWWERTALPVCLIDELNSMLNEVKVKLKT